MATNALFDNTESNTGKNGQLSSCTSEAKKIKCEIKTSLWQILRR